MALVVVAEDDPGTLKLVSVSLRNLGLEVIDVADGKTAWELIRDHSPDLIVSDINMPGLSGFELLHIVREHSGTRLTPFVLLTSLQERRDMRQGMTLGADDYITKPLRPRELQEAVSAQLNRDKMRRAARELVAENVIKDALNDQAWALQEKFEKQLASELSAQWPGEAGKESQTIYPAATVLVTEIRHYAQWVSQLGPDEIGPLLRRFFELSGDTVNLFGSSALQFVGEGVLAVFADAEPVPTAPHGLRALKAAGGLLRVCAGMDMYVRRTYPDRKLPHFELSMVMHSGPVAMAELDGLIGGHRQRIPVGETIVDAMSILRLAEPVEDGLTVSASVLRSVTGAVKPLRRYLLTLPNRPEPVDVCALKPSLI